MIEKGDKLLLIDEKGRKYIREVKNEEFHTDLGVIELGNAIGKEPGDIITSHLEKEFKLISPTIKDFSQNSKRGPQIIHRKDIGMILTYSGISPDDKIVEGGGGSGHLTMHLANILDKKGNIFTYEVREDFFEISKNNLKKSGLWNKVKLKNKDIYEGIEEENLDKVILDLPSPEKVVNSAQKSLKSGGYLISYSPCMEQVKRFKLALNKEEFQDIESIENLVREIQVNDKCTRPNTRMLGHTGYLTFARKI